MKDETKLLVQLINQNKTLNEISEILGLSNKQLFTRLSMLRNNGYLIEKEYFHDGTIRYFLSDPFFPNSKIPNELTIHIPKDTKKIRFIITSDTHLSHKKDNLIAINAVMNYCIKEGIHMILNAGDFFHGIYPNKNEVKVIDAFDQIQYGLKNYPYDKNIFTVVCLGNHDATFWLENGVDIQTILKDRRHDIVSLGYGKGLIHIGDNKILMLHPIERCNIDSSSMLDCLIIRGHSHKFKIYENGRGLTVYAPTISRVSTTANQTPIPSMIDMELTINNGVICHEYFQHYIFMGTQFIRVGEIEYNTTISCVTSKIQDQKTMLKPNLPYQMETLMASITNPHLKTASESEATLPKPIEEIDLSTELQNTIIEVVKEAVPQINDKGMSQIEKFNTRYGIDTPHTKKRTKNERTFKDE